MGFSYGFRPGRGQHDALDALSAVLFRNRAHCVLDMDIQQFFDRCDHDWMMRFIAHRVSDKRVLCLIRRWLKVGVRDPNTGRRHPSATGIPQWAVISPLLGNIYLHYVMDLWVARHRRKTRGRISVIRYADDAMLCFEYPQEARVWREALEARLQQFGLTLHPDKTQMIAFGTGEARSLARTGQRCGTFHFLGFIHYMGKSFKGKWIVKRKTQRSRLVRSLKRIRRELMGPRLQAPIAKTGAWLRSVVQGHMNYYGVPLNFRSLSVFVWEVIKSWLKALRRRSQRSRMVWSRFSWVVKQ